jgi:Mrr N-terminal domain
MTLPTEAQVRATLPSVLADFGGEARPAQVYPEVTKRFPGIAADDLAERLQDGRTSKWTNRIQWARQWLVEDGSIDPRVRGLWKLTERGWARARGEDVGAERRRPRPPKEQAEDSEVAAGDDGTAVAVVEAVPSVADLVIAHLRGTQFLSSRPEEYEQAVLAAFDFLGYATEHVGGSGDTDIVAEAPLGIGRYAIIIDTKTTARSKVAESQINFLAIDEHRRQRQADYSVIVAPDFAGGNLITRAASLRVSLLTTEQLATVVQLHAQAPFSLDDLRHLFEQGALVDSKNLNELRVLNEQIGRRLLLLGLVIDQIAEWSRILPDRVLAQPTALFAALLKPADERLIGLTPEEVEDALLILSSAGVGILRRAVNGAEGYVLTTSASGARRRLNALSSHVTALLGKTRDGTSLSTANVSTPTVSSRQFRSL